jgi:VWFA-related protein
VKEKAVHDKKVLVIVTDGYDNLSTETSLEQLVRSVRDSQVLIYSIGLLSEEARSEARKAKHELDELTEASGGFPYYPVTLSEVEQITPRIAHEIRNQYLITYSPSNEALDGSFRRIKVEVKGTSRGTSVRTRSGYYAGGPAPVNAAPAASPLR